MANWKKIREQDFDHIEEFDLCGYYMEYIIGRNYNASKAKRLIFNLKREENE